MLIKVVLPVSFACLVSLAPAQQTPTSLTRTGTYSSATLGLQAGAGGIEFDSAGRTLFINDPNRDRVMSLTVVRQTNGKITGFTNPVVVVTSRSTGSLDGGMTFEALGTMFLTNYNPGELEQYVPATRVHTVTLLSTVGVPGDTGGAEFIPRTAQRGERLLVADYDNGSIYELPLTLQANLTYTVGRAVVYLRTPSGIDGFEFVPTGPFGGGRGLAVVNYDNGTVRLVAIDPVTRNPHVDAAGNALFVPLITGLSEPMDVEFDPVTNDMFITDYSSATATLLQYSGEIRGGFDSAFDLFGPGCRQSNGQVPTLDTPAMKMRAGQPITIQVTRAPVSQAISFLVFGLGNTGNTGGFPFPGTTCRVHVNQILSVPLPTNAAGVGSISFTVPAAVRGLTVFSQAWALSPGANPLNLTVSDAAVSFVGL